MSTAKDDQWLDAALENVLVGKPIENISLTQPGYTHRRLRTPSYGA